MRPSALLPYTTIRCEEVSPVGDSENERPTSVYGVANRFLCLPHDMFMMSSDRLDYEMRCRESDSDRAAARERFAEVAEVTPVKVEPHRSKEK